MTFIASNSGEAAPVQASAEPARPAMSEARQRQLNDAKEMAALLRERGDIAKAEEIEGMLRSFDAMSEQKASEQQTTTVEADEMADSSEKQPDLSEQPVALSPSRQRQLDDAKKMAAELRERGDIEKADEIEAVLRKMPGFLVEPSKMEADKAPAPSTSSGDQPVALSAERRQKLDDAKKMAAELRERGDIEKAEDIEAVLRTVPGYLVEADKVQEVQADKVVEADKVEADKAADPCDNPLVQETMLAVKELLRQGQDEKAAQLLAMLEWAASDGQVPPPVAIDMPAVKEVKEEGKKEEKSYTAAEVLQMEEAKQLISELRANGLNERADEIEGTLQSFAPSGDHTLAEMKQKLQIEEARTFVSKLQAAGQVGAAKEITNFIEQMEMHMRVDDLAKNRQDKANLDKMDSIMSKIDEQVQMIGEYVESVEDMIPSSKNQSVDAEQFGEVVAFLNKFADILDRQLTLGKCWVQQLGKDQQAKYTKRLQDGQDTIQTILMLMQQFEGLQASLTVSNARMKALEVIEKQAELVVTE